jgi:hypothetical protein
MVRYDANHHSQQLERAWQSRHGLQEIQKSAQRLNAMSRAASLSTQKQILRFQLGHAIISCQPHGPAQDAWIWVKERDGDPVCNTYIVSCPVA